MQLILNTENPSVNINEKMSTLNPETEIEKPLPNGDMKEIVEEVSGKPKSHGTSDKENESKDKNLNKCDEVQNHDEAGNFVTAEKLKEALKQIQECAPMEVSTSTVEKENEKENIVFNEEKSVESDSKNIPQTSEKENLKLYDEESPVTEGNEDSESNEKELLKPKEQELDEKEKLDLDKKENEEQDDILKVESDETQRQDPEMTKKLELDETEELELDETEKLELEKGNNVEPESTKSLKLNDDTEKLELVESERHEIIEKHNKKEKLDQNVTEQLGTVESEKLDLDEMNEIEKDKSKSVDLNKTDELVQKTTENEDFIITEEIQLEENRLQELDVSAKSPSDVAEKLSLTEEVPVSIVQESDTIAEKADIVKSVEEKAETMEVDEGDSFIDQELEDSSEKCVTQSISDMVENIVQNLNEDTADDSMDGIEIDNNENVGHKLDAQDNIVQKTDESSAVKDSSNNSKAGDSEITQENIVKRNETPTQTETISNLEEDNNEMDVDQEEHDVNSVVEIPENTKSTDNSPITPKKLSSSVVFNEENIIKDIEEDIIKESPSLEGGEKASNESNKVVFSEIRDEEQNSLNRDIKLDTPAKENKAVLLNGDEIAQTNTDSSSIVKKLENKKDEIDITENSAKVIELKSGDSSPSKLEESGSTIAKMEDDIIACSDVEKERDNANEHVLSEISDKQSEIPNADVSETKDDTSDVEEVKLVVVSENVSEQVRNEKTPEKVTPLIKLSNTMDILSDEEEETPAVEPPKKITEPSEKQCINLDDDDDIMLIDDDTNKEERKETQSTESTIEKVGESITMKNDSKVDVEDSKDDENKIPEEQSETEKESIKPETQVKEVLSPQPQTETSLETVTETPEKSRSLIPGDLFKSYRKNLADMTRDDLEEFCILKIVESIIDRSNINEIRSKLKSMGQTIEEYKKKAMMLTKQNRDLQVVLKSVQEEQKKSNGTQAITPLKITRSVGMQVLMTDKNRRRIVPGQTPPTVVNNSNQANNRNVRNTTQSPRNTPQKPTNYQPIPVPRLVPAGPNIVNKAAAAPGTPVNSNAKPAAVQNGVKNISPAQKPEKRTHNRMQSQSSSVTVDLTDDEPPSKIPTKSSPAPPVRLVNQQNLIAPRQQFTQQVNSPRKVYIPISINGPQTQTMRPGQTIMLKTVSSQGPRPRGPAPSMVRAPQNVQVRRLGGARHPAPLPDAMKQYQPPNWKALPPAPDLKLSKVENGIVISWKIEGYQEDSYEEIASYQLYAYQETAAPPSTTLWKKIGDVKALPLPMACTLTQFMAGYKYYFAVRAVDIRSRFGPFSLPGSILLLNKM